MCRYAEREGGISFVGVVDVCQSVVVMLDVRVNDGDGLSSV